MGQFEFTGNATRGESRPLLRRANGAPADYRSKAASRHCKGEAARSPPRRAGRRTPSKSKVRPAADGQGKPCPYENLKRSNNGPINPIGPYKGEAASNGIPRSFDDGKSRPLPARRGGQAADRLRGRRPDKSTGASSGWGARKSEKCRPEGRRYEPRMTHPSRQRRRMGHPHYRQRRVATGL